jgi:tetratricopeptide (TPR) repeat protein
MVQLFKRNPKEDAARQRYPEALWPLLSLGEPDEKTDYHQLAQPLAPYVSDLIQMALDDDLNYREQDDPAVWAPLHAMQILGALGAVEAAEPLTQCLESNNDWDAEALPDVYAGIGPAAVPVLQAYLEDATHDMWGRIHASHALAAIAQAHPEARDTLVRYMTDYLDRPTADDSAEEECVTTFVITDLADLEAREAYPAIKRAYDEDRVDLSVIGLEDVEADLGMRPKPDYSKLEPPQEPGVRLELKCKVCGRERSYLFPKVYCDLGTIRDKKKRAKYDPIIIPQAVVCSKCGAVDQYELAGMGHIALIADLLAQTAPELGDLRREDQHIQYMEFEAMGRKMHPLEAIERYRDKIARHPDDSELYIGYGNVLRFLGRFDEAEAQYQRVMEMDPFNPDAYAEMAVLALKQRNKKEAIAFWQKVLEVTPNSQVPDRDKSLYLESAREAIEAIRSGREEELGLEPVMTSQRSSAGAQPSGGRSPGTSKPSSRKREATSLSSSQARLPKLMPGKKAEVGRNDPCPCGSGKKYKHCCMRKKRR